MPGGGENPMFEALKWPHAILGRREGPYSFFLFLFFWGGGLSFLYQPLKAKKGLGFRV